MILQVGIAVDAVVLESHARAGAAKCVPGHFGWMVLDENPRSMKILVVGRRWPPQDASVRYMAAGLTITTKGILRQTVKVFWQAEF
jgi:hypothetical protein